MKIGRKSKKYEVSGKSNQVRGSYIGVKSQWSLWSPTLQYPLQPTTDQRNMAVTNDSCKWDACHWKSTCATPTPFQIKHPRKHGGCRGWNHIFGTFLGVFNMKWGWDYPFVSIIIYIMCIYIYITHYSWYSSWLLHTPSVYIQNAGFASFLFAWIPDGGRRSESIAAVFPGAVLKRATSLLFVRERSNQYYSTGMFSIVWFKCFHLYGMYDGRVRLL